MGSSNGDNFLMRPAGLNAAFGRGCLMEGAVGPFSTVGEGGEEDSVERAENQGYSLTVSFQTFGSVAWCMMAYTASMIMYASTGGGMLIMTDDISVQLTYQCDNPRETKQDFPREAHVRGDSACSGCPNDR